jgi:hypothetical protein
MAETFLPNADSPNADILKCWTARPVSLPDLSLREPLLSA